MPRVWVLSSPRAGERSQLLALAEALGCPFEVKQIVHRRFGSLRRPARRRDLAGVDLKQSDALDGPWPDLVLLAHQSNENVARWIRRQSGGQHPPRPDRPARGRPSRRSIWWSPRRSTSCPRRPTSCTTRCRCIRWPRSGWPWPPPIGSRASPICRGPFVTVLVGGSSGPYVFDAAAAERGSAARPAPWHAAWVAACWSPPAHAPRQPRSTRCSRRSTPQPACIAGRLATARTPISASSALADRIVVTADSISMIAEACATGQPGADVRFRQRRVADARRRRCGSRRARRR